jgi:hypothetical protein
MLKLFLSIAILVNTMQSACLTAEQLATMGFKEYIETPEKAAEGGLCAGMNMCVSLDSLEGQIKSQLGRLNGKNKEKGEKLGKRVKENGKKMKDVAKGIKESKGEGNTKRDKIKNKPDEKQEKRLEKINELCTTEDCSDFAEKLEASSENKEKCRKSIYTNTVGNYCLMLSDQASDKITFSESDLTFSTEILDSIATSIFENCTEHFDNLCSLHNFFASVKATQGKAQGAKKGKSKRFGDVCDKWEEIKACTGDACKALYMEAVEGIVSFGKNGADGDPDDEEEGTDKDLSDFDDQIKSGTGTDAAQRLLQATEGRMLEELTVTADNSISFSSSGFDTQTVGESSGIDFNLYISVTALTMGIVSMFVTLL